MGGSIQKILIANRGEIARRIMRTCRALGIGTVAVCSTADRDTPFAQEADETVLVGGPRPAESYLRIDALLDAARQTGADAIHPGYGFLSENAEFARACEQAGLTFIGPPSDVIAAMGSKIAAKQRMQSAGVPVLPSVTIGDQSPGQVLEQVEALGWPVLIKSSAGGGGRGMRIVRDRDALAAQLEMARQEAVAAFGDGALLIEPYVEASRHIEVQIFGDTHGNVVHLFERECSIQRRHQKIIEESPSPALDDALREAMTGAAVRAAKAMGYVNAGTVEFLLTPERKFYFLEVNTRLQVEHPVTECVTGLDLVRLQILVAQGETLPAEAHAAKLQGHAIEARLYAEDPCQDYRPSAGPLHCFQVPSSPGIRLDSALDAAGTVSPFYDPMLAKVIVHAPTRLEAARQLSDTLARARIHGLRTNRELLVRVLRHEAFLAGQTDTHFLQRYPAADLAGPLGGDEAERWHAVAAALALQAEHRRDAAVLRSVPSGWRNVPSQPQRLSFEGHAGPIVVEYQFARQELQLRINGQQVSDVRCESATPEQVRLQVGTLSRTFEVRHYATVGNSSTVCVDSTMGSSSLTVIPRFAIPEEQQAAGSLVAPLPGVVHEVRVKLDDTVAAGDVLLVIDSMKVHHWISAPHAGRISELRVEAGQHVQGGSVLVVIEETA